MAERRESEEVRRRQAVPQSERNWRLRALFFSDPYFRVHFRKREEDDGAANRLHANLGVRGSLGRRPGARGRHDDV